MIQTSEQIVFCDELAFGTESIVLNAVAGSGKTTTILMGLKECGRKPEETLLLAFNKKIAEELTKRAPKGTNVLTLNSLGHRAWMKHTGKRVFLDARKVGTIVSDMCRNKNPEVNRYLQGLWAPCKDLVAKAKSVGILPERFSNGMTIMEDTYENWESLAALHSIEFSKDIHKIAHAALEKSTELALSGTIDFDDQLYMPAVFRANLDKYKLVLVDEAQDLSELQHFLISRTVDKSGKLIIVGDPHQAIYGFRGAHSDSMRVLGEKFSAKELTLSYTFRCPQTATTLAQAIVPAIQPAPANLSGEVRNFGLNWKDEDIEDGAAVLCRNIAPLVKLGLKLISSGRSAYIAGRDIGAPLIKAAKTLRSGDLLESVYFWENDEIVKAGNNLALKERTYDISEALQGVIELSKAEDSVSLVLILQQLFAKTEGSIVLSTIHRAKGLEWDNVYILDYWRMPQKWIIRAIKDSPDAEWMLGQEENLKYIALTRTKNKLTFISYPEK